MDQPPIIPLEARFQNASKRAIGTEIFSEYSKERMEGHKGVPGIFCGM